MKLTARHHLVHVEPSHQKTSGGASESDPRQTPIAVIGMGCRFPGGANSPSAFWKLLTKGTDAVREVPEDRWSVQAHFAPAPPKPGKTYSRWGGFIDGIDQFDAGFFGISPREAESMDPQQRILLEVAWEAIENAGLPGERLAGRLVGVYVGASSNEYLHVQWDADGNQGINAYTNAGGALSILANRVSHLLDLRGPSMTIDTACSSSLVALHYACESLRNGDCEVALAGGVNLLLGPSGFVGFSQAHMLSPDGRCRSFDEQANGFVRGEGAGVIVLKSLARALEDGDSVHALVVGTGVNQDGRTSGISLPNEEAQVALLQKVYEQAGIDPATVGYVEAHGTGTPAGDPIEARALGRVLGVGRTNRAIPIGSVKSNIGHLEPASGIAGVIKCVLALKHARIPRSLHFNTPNPEVDFESLGLRVAAKAEPWASGNGDRRIAGVNSFGFGGTNSHAVLAELVTSAESGECDAGFGLGGQEQTPASSPTADHGEPPDGLQSQLILLTASSESALRSTADRWVDWLGPGQQTDLAGIAYTAAVRRTHHSHRLAIVADRVDQLHERLDAWRHGEERREISSGRASATGQPALAFAFNGMGSQWPGMGLELLQTEPEFAILLEKIDRVFTGLSGWSIREQLTADEFQSRIHETEVAQPAIFAVQVGLAALWKSWGIEPDLVVGHSVGEVAAAHVAGILSLEDAVSVVFHRSRLQHSLRGQGRMLAVGLPADLAEPLVEGYDGRVAIAAVNSPGSITLSGESAALEELHFGMEASQTFCRFLNVDIPYHSGTMSVIREDLEESLRNLESRPASVPFYSTVTGGRIADEPLDADYWWRNVRQPVLFDSAMQAVRDAGIGAVVEIGAHPVLMMSIRECLGTSASAESIITSMRRGEAQRSVLLSGLGRLFTLGYPVHWDRVEPRRSATVSLPQCVWERDSYWSETEGHHSARLGTGSSGGSGLLGETEHPLLGQPVQTSQAERAWRLRLDLDGQHHWLLDHQVQKTPVFPGAGFAELALAAGRLLYPRSSLCIESMEISRPMILDAGRDNAMETTIDPLAGDVTVRSRDKEGGWSTHMSGRVRSDFGEWNDFPDSANELRDRCSDEHTPDELYDRFETIGLNYGPAFRGIDTAHTGDMEVWGRVRLPDALQSSAESFILHPAALDACLQMLLCAGQRAGTSHEIDEPKLYLPVRVGKLRVREPDRLARIVQENGLIVSIRLVEKTTSRVIANLTLLDQSGQTAAEIRGLEAVAFPNRDQKDIATTNCFWIDRWEQRPQPGQPFVGGMPEPHCLAQIVQPTVDRLRAEHDRERYFREIRPAREKVAIEFAIETLRKLGFRGDRGETRTDDQLVTELSIAESQERLLSSVLRAVQQTGLLQRTPEGWQGNRELPPTSALTTWREVGTRWPVLHSELLLLARTGTRLADVLRGEVNPLELIFPDGSNDVTEPIYEDGPGFLIYNLLLRTVVAAVVDELAPDRPLRVLEIGGGTGSTSGFVLPLLPAERTRYVFTDVSPQFFGPAENKFRQFPFIEFTVLDLERDPFEQDFEPQSFDIILGANVVHTTADIRQSLKHIKALLAPDGLMMLVEVTNRGVSHDLTFGVLNGWWRFADLDLRNNSPLLSWPQWQKVLTDEGFRDVTGISDAIEGEESEQTILLARAPAVADSDAKPNASTGLWWIVADDRESARPLVQRVQSSGGQTVVITTGTQYQHQEDGYFQVRADQPNDYRALCSIATSQGLFPATIVHTGGLSAPVEDDLTSAALQQAQRSGTYSVLALVQAVAEANWSPAPRLWLVTRGAMQPDHDDRSSICLASTPLWGMARVIANELPQLRCSLIDLAAVPNDTEFDVIVREISSNQDETEVALRAGGKRYVPRLASGESHIKTEQCSTESFHVAVGTPGMLDTVSLQPAVAESAGPGEVEIDVVAAAVNFKDVAKALGLLTNSTLRGTWSEKTLGIECAGRVSAVGPGVSDFDVGDRVVALAADCFRPRVVTRADLVRRLPENLTFEESAGLPVVFLTASYALNDLARLREGERVLIHAAAGGVGLAAIQVAQHIGAEIIATAGSPIKRDYLRALGVSHVFDSRSLSFVDGVRGVTDGEGVDVVLNSLAGAALPASLSLLRPGGRFVEIGKRDIQDNAHLGLKPFDNNIAFFALDLDRLLEQGSRTGRQLLDSLMAGVAEKKYAPIPYRTFPVSGVAKAFRHMAKARQIGKIVLRIQDQCVRVRTQMPEKPGLRFDPEAIYLVTGGFNGFGLATAHWLVQHGARHLALLSRRGGDSEDTRQAVADLEAVGAQIIPLKADVAEESQVADALHVVRQTGRSLRGVFHAAMVLDDDSLLQLTPERMERVLGPKAWGAWNLHRLTGNDPLDHFVLFSSATTLFGNPGQASYVAACTFLDQLARQRQASDLPGLSVAFGAVADVGYVARNQKVLQHVVERLGLQPLPAQQMLDFLERLIVEQLSNMAVFPADWSRFEKANMPIADTPRLSTIARSVDESAGESDASLGQMREAVLESKPADRPALLRSFLIDIVAGALGASPSRIESDRSLTLMGLDSLMAVDLQTRVSRQLGCEIPSMRLMSGPSIDELAADLFENFEAES